MKKLKWILLLIVAVVVVLLTQVATGGPEVVFKYLDGRGQSSQDVEDVCAVLKDDFLKAGRSHFGDRFHTVHVTLRDGTCDAHFFVVGVVGSVGTISKKPPASSNFSLPPGVRDIPWEAWVVALVVVIAAFGSSPKVRRRFGFGT